MAWAGRLTPAIICPPAVAAVLLATCSPPVAAEPGSAAGVVRAFELGFSGEVFGDFIEVGNGNVRCPDGDSPADPGGTPAASCAQAQRGHATGATAVNDSYYMRHADVDGSAATFNSSRARFTVPEGAAVTFARLSWAGDTGRIRLADGTEAPGPACNDRQFLPGAGAAVPPPGAPETTPVQLTVGTGAPVTVPPVTFTVDPAEAYGPSNPQYYSAHADVTEAFATVPTGAPVAATVGNVWTPEGFGCFAGWSLTLVYAFGGPDPEHAPVRRAVHVYGGHVRQASDTAPTTTEVAGMRVAGGRARVGVTAFEGDLNIGRDQLTVNGTPLPEARTGRGANFFVSAADGAYEPAVPINLSVDAKAQSTDVVPAGATGATLTFGTGGDSYLATGLAFSAPIPAVTIVHEPVGEPVRPGQPVEFRVTVSALGAGVTEARVTDALFPECRKDVGTLGAGESHSYTCSSAAPRTDTTSLAAVTAVDAFGYPLTATHETPVAVVDHPGVDLTKLTVNVNRQASYAPGETVSFTLITTNTGDAPLHDVVLDDPTVPACSTRYSTLEPGESVEKRCTAVAPVPGEVNAATVTATDDAGAGVTDTASAPVPSAGGTISGFVLADRNGNGAHDAADGDSPIAGAPIALAGRTDRGTPVEATTSSGPDGRYVFAVPAGTYRITAPQPDRFHDGPEVPGPGAVHNGNDALLVTLPSGGTSDGNTFAEHAASGLAGRLFDDTDGNGRPGPGEPGTEGVPVTLTGADEAGTQLTLTAVTAADGSYAFPRLRPGTYALSQPPVPGLLSGVATPGSAGGTATSPDTISGIVLGPDTPATGYHFASSRPAGLAGTVVDDGGAGVPGVPVTVTGRTPAGAPVERATTTGPNGLWNVPDLPTGTYTVLVPQPPGYGDGPNTAGTAGGTSSGPDTISRIPLAGGQQAGGYTFGLTRAAISGTVYVDVDGDGARGADEPGIGGAAVTVTGTDAAGGTVERSATSGPDGGYRVGELLGGSYAVTQSQPEGYADGPDSPGSAGGTATGSDTITGVEAAGGATASGYDFGERGARVSGVVADEAGRGLAGMPVALAGTDTFGTGVERETTTRDDGGFAVPGLPAGSYVVSTARPDGYGDGPDAAGTAGGGPSGPDTIAGIDLGPGETATGYRFTHGLGSAGGVVYVDRDRDGTHDTDESTVDGVEVTVTGTTVTGEPARATATTAGDGSYRVDGLVAGDYTVADVESGEYADVDRTGVSVPAGEDVSGLDVGLRAGALAGRFEAEDGEAVAGVGVTVSGTSVNGREAGGTTTTGDDGSWAVPDLPAGTYTVVARQPAGYGDGPDSPGTAGGSATATNRITGITLTPGQEADGYRFTATLGSVAGHVFVDEDGDGRRDEGEPGVDGVTVGLTGADVAGNAVERTVVTGADGGYRIGGLRAGRYMLVETQPPGYADGTALTGTAGGTAVNPDVVQGIQLTAGADAEDYDFLERPSTTQPGPTPPPAE